MPSKPSFVEMLQSYMRRDDIRITLANLSNLSGVPKATIANWLDGLVERPRRWQHILKIADALQLDESATDQLLTAAGHEPIASLYSTAGATDQVLFFPWRAIFDHMPPLARSPNLQPPTSVLVGRDRERAQLRNLLLRPEVQLITLTGVGGSGKTHLARAIASEFRALFADGVWFVNLAPLTDPHLVVPTIAEVFGITEVPNMRLIERLGETLRARQLLVVLDNFEHMLPATPHIVQLLAAAPQLRLLVTSRAILRVYNEHELSVLPLALPAAQKAITPAQIAKSPAVELFVRRARLASADFALSASNAATIAAICVRLDGLPLAIELAAANIATHTPEQLFAQLASGLELLQGSAEHLPARQQTMQATLDWSYHLLDDAAHVLFARLAVFTSGWTAEAAAEICSDADFVDQFAHMPHFPHNRLDTLDTLTTLADHSLIVRTEMGDGISRYLTLETLREYAVVRLRIIGEFDRMKQRHAAYYLRQAERREPQLTSPKQLVALMWFEHEHNNFRAALQWFVDQQQREMVCRLSAALWRFWLIRGHLSEGRRWLEVGLAERHALPIPVAIKALLAAGQLARQQADLEQARTYLEAALALEQEHGDQQTIALLLGRLGVVAYDMGNFAWARLLHEQSLAIRSTLNDSLGIAATLTNLGEVARQEHREAEAQTFHEQSLELFRSQQDLSGIALALLNLGQIVGQRGDYEHAMTLLHQSLRLWQSLGEQVNIAECFEALAAIAAIQQQFVQAAQLGGAAEALRTRVGAPLAPAEQARYQHQRSTLRAQMDKSHFVRAWRQGQAMSLQEAIIVALGES